MIRMTKPLLITALFLILLTLWLRTDESIPGIYRTRLNSQCQITHFTLRSQQPIRILTLDCVGVDSIKFWPWPIEYPWAEDWFEQPKNTLYQEV